MMQNIVDDENENGDIFVSIFAGSVGIYLSIYATLRVVTFNQG